MKISFAEFKSLILESLLDEADIDTDKLYFHGSSNGNIKTINNPTPNRPLFVTADIDYANEYLQAAHPNGRAKFNEDDNEGKVYLIDLDFSKIKLFDAADENDRERMTKWWPSYILDQLKLHKYSIWSVFKYIVPGLKKFYVDYKGNFEEFSKAINADSEFKDDMGKESFLNGVKFIHSKYGKTLQSLFSSKSEDDVLFDLIAIFNTTLTKEGYNAFRNTEVMKAGKVRKHEIKTNNAIGIMDDSCIKDFTPKPLDSATVKQAIYDLQTDDELKKNYSKSNSGIIDKIVDVIDDKSSNVES